MKTLLVAGADRGIGEALCVGLHERGERVIARALGILRRSARVASGSSRAPTSPRIRRLLRSPSGCAMSGSTSSWAWSTVER
jgi:NAD(P)-dependent dehydrogenase (short-subunit alcohol dehydrogenase family)